MKHTSPSVTNLLPKIFAAGIAVVIAGMLVTCIAPVPFGFGEGDGDGGGAPDTTPPANVTNITTTVVAGSAADTVDVTINWTDPADSDFSHVEITRAPNGSRYSRAC